MDPRYPFTEGDATHGPPLSRSHQVPRGVDRTMGWILTFVGLLVIFLLIVSLLSNIAPNAPTELVPTMQPVTTDRPDLGIQGD